MAIFNDEIEDRVRFAFDDSQIRAFRANQLHVLEIVVGTAAGNGISSLF